MVPREVEARDDEFVDVPARCCRMSDEEFMAWCAQHGLHISSKLRVYPKDERMAIYRYLVRTQQIGK